MIVNSITALRPTPLLARAGTGVLCVLASALSLAGNAMPAPAHSARTPDQIASSANGASASVNWAGYADTGAAFTDVAGSWTQPAATCPSNTSQLAAFWLGIDGFSSSDPNVEQIGTDSDCTKGKGKAAAIPSDRGNNGNGNGNGKGSGGNGKGGGKAGGGPIYYGWYEFYPQPPVFLDPSTYPVAPGDSISAHVNASGSAFTLTLTDATQGWQFSTNQNVTPMPAESSAEWIAESPQSCAKKKCANVPLADFTSLSFSGASANGQAISSPSFVKQEITMEKRKGKVVRALPSALSGGGNAFTITWEHL